jgi:B12-binding domain/radical SAM domain protein
VPATPIFDVFPIGFISIVEYLHRFGYKVDIINLAAKMLEKRNLDVTKFLKSLNSPVFGLDLHWLPHVQGCLEVARILKNLHPNSKIILGGFTSTFFNQEILTNFHFIDGIIKGDSGEYPIKKYLENNERNSNNINDVPNLSWRKSNGKISINPITYVQDNLDELVTDYKFIATFMMKNIFNSDRTPYFEWKNYPIAATLSCKGCIYNCVTCGGSKHSFYTHFGRKKIGLRDPHLLTEDIVGLSSYGKIPVWIIGDIRQGGKFYADKLLKEIKKQKIDSPIIVELFEPAEKDFINDLSRNLIRYGISFSPDSANEYVRRSQGKNFTNSDIEKTVKYSLESSASRLDLFFLLGLGRDDYSTIQETYKFSERLMDEYSNKKLNIYMSTLAPTLDPGSISFDNPSQHGFHLLNRTLLEHYQSFENPSWKYFLNYETDSFNVDDIVNLTYRTAIFMTDLKYKFNIIDSKEANNVKDRIALSKKILSDIDIIMDVKDKKDRFQRLENITDIVQRIRGDRVIHAINELDRRHI